MTEQVEEQSLDRKDLKIRALLEKNMELQNANADLRVEITVLEDEANRQIRALSDALNTANEEVQNWKDSDVANTVQAKPLLEKEDSDVREDPDASE
jgi:hypothetical protein